ncbi:Aspartyl-tRNA(Asn) amidotransferase subunit A @ Glutamyl-tRNA(Gln) amidotransferase subunit A [hydrothermal vent metagenome]|uniref:glutaminyl-tRNA synthase (glutamine-hydrolyzing) n=1 Tax=hydrothermal vent metagenome TaxID=652676 RepID=A0A3B1CPT0_9ZZZZ
MSDLCHLTIRELLNKLKASEITSEEVTRAYLARIDEVDKKINSYVTVDADGALEQAREADKKRANGEDGALLGVPLALKDLIVTKGLRTTCSSKILENFVPPYDAFVTKKLKEAGAVIIGKTNMDEFAMGSSSETSYFGAVRNPWNTDKIPGGSSGGSAAAVSANLCAGALGSDTGGSIRQPAALCGVVGLKPTYGRVSRFGLVAFASSLDQIGPMTKDVEDAAILMNAIAGHDSMDSTCANEPVPDYTADINKGVSGLKIGIPEEYFTAGLDGEIEKSIRDNIKLLEDDGAEIVPVSLPHTKYGVPTYYVLAPAEASSNLARYDGVRYGFRAKGASGLADMYKNSRKDGFGAEVKRRIMLGTYALSSGYYDAYYLKAQKVRTLIKNDFLEAFKKVDVIVTPTTPTAAFGIGEKTDDPLEMYLSDILTINANIAGIPGISVPCGFTSDGLPIGLQALGAYFDEASLLRVAKVVEQKAGVVAEQPSI